MPGDTSRVVPVGGGFFVGPPPPFWTGGGAQADDTMQHSWREFAWAWSCPCLGRRRIAARPCHAARRFAQRWATRPAHRRPARGSRPGWMGGRHGPRGATRSLFLDSLVAGASQLLSTGMLCSSSTLDLRVRQRIGCIIPVASRANALTLTRSAGSGARESDWVSGALAVASP